MVVSADPIVFACVCLGRMINFRGRACCGEGAYATNYDWGEDGLFSTLS